MILSLYGRIRVTENPYSLIFYVVQHNWKNTSKGHEMAEVRTDTKENNVNKKNHLSKYFLESGINFKVIDCGNKISN